MLKVGRARNHARWLACSAAAGAGAGAGALLQVRATDTRKSILLARSSAVRTQRLSAMNQDGLNIFVAMVITATQTRSIKPQTVSTTALPAGADPVS